MSNVFVINCQAHDDNLLAVCSNLKQVHKVLTNIQGNEAPSYDDLAQFFKQRKEYHLLSKHYWNNDEYRSLDVTWVEINYHDNYHSNY